MYAILDFIRDLGGVFEVVHACLGLLIFPIVKYLFFIKAISKLYYADTQSQIFKLPTSYQHNDKQTDH